VWANATAVHPARCGISSSQEFDGKAWIGVMLSLIGDIIINVGMNAMKHAHNINTDPETKKPLKHFTRVPWWWCGILGIIGGEVGNLIAYGYAPASIVTPIGSIGVVTNVIITTYVLKEPLTWRILLGVAFVIAGIVIVVIFAPLTVVFVGSANLWRDVLFTANFGIYLAWMAVMLLILFPLSNKYGEKSVVIYVSLCAVIASLTIVCAKTFSTMVSNGLQNGMKTEFLTPWPYATLLVMVATCVSSMGYVNKAMMVFGNSQVVPVYFALFTTAGVGSAAWVYHEFQCLENPAQGVLFVFGILVAVVGVFLVSTGTAKKVVPDDAADEIKGQEKSDVEQGACRDCADDATPDNSSRVGKNPSFVGRSGPCAEDHFPSTPSGPELEHRTDARIMADAPTELTWQAALSPVYDSNRAQLHGRQALAAAPEQHTPTDAMSPQSRLKREKQMKEGRCGLSQLKPLPPLAKCPVSGSTLPALVSSPSPLPP